MANCPASVIAHQKRASQEATIQRAIVAIKVLGYKRNGKDLVYSLTQAAKDFDVPKTTLTERFNGRSTHAQAAQDQQRLTPAQEKVLVAWIKSCGARGMGLTAQAVMEAGSMISGTELGETWYRLFIARHRLDIRGRWALGLEAPRAQCLNRTTCEEFFLLLEHIVDEYKIAPENTYNMDEKGVMMGLGQKTFVLADRNQASVNVIEDGNRELVTVIECISADGRDLDPTVIFKGVRRDLAWGRHSASRKYR
jgi:hypothetical protein